MSYIVTRYHTFFYMLCVGEKLTRGKFILLVEPSKPEPVPIWPTVPVGTSTIPPVGSPETPVSSSMLEVLMALCFLIIWPLRGGMGASTLIVGDSLTEGNTGSTAAP